MLNFDHEKRPTFQPGQRPDQVGQRLDFRAHYQELAVRTLLSVRRHWLLIASLVVLVVALALSVIPLLPRKYSATAFILPNLYSQEQGKIVALASVDASSFVNGEARLVLSDTILQAVVARLGPQQPPEAMPDSGLFRSMSLPEVIREVLPESGWLRSMFFPEMLRSDSPLDHEMSILRRRVEVAKDPRSYLISISFTTSSADEAARVVNTIAVEYLRDKWLQRSREAVIAAEMELTRQRAVNGEKHPRVLLAVDALDVARADLNAATAPDDSGQNSARTEEGVKLALPNRTPTSPKGTVIVGLSSVAGLLAGIGLAIWRDRRNPKAVDLASGRTLLRARAPDAARSPTFRNEYE